MTLNSPESCRWIIDFTLELATPMHVGTGKDISEKLDGKDPWLAELCLDAAKDPTIPGASFKGALRAFAERTKQFDGLSTVFGDASGEKPTAGLAEFRYGQCAHLAAEPFLQPHVAIDRVTGTAMDKKLFNTRLVPAASRFNFQIILHRSTGTSVQALLGLLHSLTQDSGFALGAQGSKGLGQLSLHGSCKVQRFGKTEAANWLAQGGANHWARHAKEISIKATSKQPTAKRVALPITLNFDSPFLVKGGIETIDDRQVTVPVKRGDRVLLPGSSLRGRLRSQAERILKTLGIPTRQGHDAKPHRKNEPHDDLAAVLFGSAGWRGIVGTGDFLDKNKSDMETIQEFVAIDRFTGGGLDSAKFSIKPAQSPKLSGQLTLDFERLNKIKEKQEDTYWAALGLLTLVLRDLSEGDIAFGHGIAKGYGHCTAAQVLEGLDKLLREQAPEHTAPIHHALEQLRKIAGPERKTEAALQTDKAAAFPEFKPTSSHGGFHNPYHFIPLSKPDLSTWTSQETLEETRGHDRYQGHSGRITCTLTTQTPLFIGAQREEGKNGGPATAKGYEFGGKPAIPATSLRGMISSLFESISRSNFRVLHPTKYSMRKDNKQALSAMGRIVMQNDTMYLKPLTLPTLTQSGNTYPIPEKWRKLSAFKNRRVPLRVYFDADPEEYRASELYYIHLDSVISNDGQLFASPLLRYPDKGRNTKFLIGQKIDQQKPISEAAWKNKPAAEQEKYTFGWVRTLETRQRRRGDLLPNTVRHLVFLPESSESKLLPINNCRDRFEELSDLSLNLLRIKQNETITDAKLTPFVPCGRKTENDRNNSTTPRYATRLQHGDLVFFDINEKSIISEISFSSMWRTGINKFGSSELATTADLLAKYDSNLLPLGMKGRDKRFSPAELLFGTVEWRPEGNEKKENKSLDQAQALAGRVQFSIAQARGEVKTEPAITLKELSSPKPPSPALYFKPIDKDNYVSKGDLAKNSDQFTLRGRKTYLHAWRDEQGKVIPLNDEGNKSAQGRLPWVSKHHGQPDEGHKRRVQIKPISSGQTFTFHVDFNNLSQTELEQLCASLMPDPNFEHRLGMGKPIGLGSVKIEIQHIETVDRAKRYAEDGLDAHRHTVLAQSTAQQLARSGMAKVPGDVRRAIQLLGNPKAVGVPVHYPQVKDGLLENEHFNWFMTNDKNDKNAIPGNKNQLTSISANTPEIPKLIRYDTSQQNQGNNRR